MTNTAITTRISSLFEACKAESRKAFIAYITAGDPTPDHTVSLVLALERGGPRLQPVREVAGDDQDPERRHPSLRCPTEKRSALAARGRASLGT